jgi:hypothetical protein
LGNGPDARGTLPLPSGPKTPTGKPNPPRKERLELIVKAVEKHGSLKIQNAELKTKNEEFKMQKPEFKMESCGGNVGGLRPRQFANAELPGTMFICPDRQRRGAPQSAPKSSSGSYLFGCSKVILNGLRLKWP